MSSTEAEIIAASALSLEAVHFRALLTEMGLPQAEPTVIHVDNSGAVELSRDRKSCHRSRHVDRRYFKVRELVYAGHLKVEHIETDKNWADLLTKSLDEAAYLRHRSALMGEAGRAHAEGSGLRGRAALGWLAPPAGEDTRRPCPS